MESEVSYPQLADPAFMSQFDVTMTYKQDSTIWCAYFGTAMVPDLLRPPQPKTEAAPAVFFASNPFDHTRRGRYVLDLMNEIDVDSYGRVLRNRTLPSDQGRETKLDVISRYRFTLAPENSICRDYVTEKFFHPLLVGSVPVYFGAPNIEEFAPGNHCFINAGDFADPRDLGEYLRSLCTDEAAYQQFFDWKTNDLRADFMNRLDQVRIEPFCRLAMLLRGECTEKPTRTRL